MGQVASKCAKCLGLDEGDSDVVTTGEFVQAVPGGGGAGRPGHGAVGGAGGAVGVSAEVEPPPPPPIPPNERCVVEGPGLQQVAGFAGESTHFMVACFKENLGEMEHFVVSNLIVQVQGPTTLVPTIAATKIGARVSYTARKAGTYNVHIKYYGDDVPGTPIPVVILPGKTDGSRSHVQQPSGLVQGVMVLPLFMEQKVKIVTRDACDNEREVGGLTRGFGLKTELVAEDFEEEAFATRTENEDKAWRYAKKKPQMAGPLRKKRFGGFSGWEACHFCLAGDALFYAASSSDSQPRGVLYLTGARVRDLGGGTFEVFCPLAYSRANVVKEKQVNRVFTLGAVKGDPKVAASWIKAIEGARPLDDGDLLEGRDAHMEGRGFSMSDIANLRQQIQNEEQGQAVNQVAWENIVRAEGVKQREEEEAERERVKQEEEKQKQEDESISLDHVQPVLEQGHGKENEDGKGLTSKQARVQAAMRDPSLSPQERQRRIQEIMRQPAEEAKADAGGGGGGGGGSKQDRIRALMRDTTIDPADKQRRIAKIMSEPAAGGSEAGAGASAGAGGGGVEGAGGGGSSDADKERLKAQQKRVAAMVAAGKAEIGKIQQTGGDKVGGDREVDVRFILGGLDDQALGDEDLISLGQVLGTLTVADVKASAAFGLQQLGMSHNVELTPDRTRLIVRSTGEVLTDEDRQIQYIDPSTPSLMLLLVPRELEASTRAALANTDIIGDPSRASAAIQAVPASDTPYQDPSAFRVSSKVDDGFEVLSLESGQASDRGGNGVKFGSTNCTIDVRDNQNGTYWMSFSFVARGVYKVTVTYNGVPLKGGTFQVVVLRPESYLRVKSAVMSPQKQAVNRDSVDAREYISYEAMLLGDREQWTKVDIRFTHRHMTMYKAGGMLQAITGFKVGGRLYTVPIRSNVKFFPLANGPKVSVSDGSGIELCLSSPERSLVQATFYMQLHARMAGAGGTFEQRRLRLFRDLKRQCPPASGAQVIRVRRSKILQDAMEKCMPFEDKVWRQDWQIRFEGEQGVDWGGLQREFFSILGREIFSTKKKGAKEPFFTQMGTQSGPLVHPNIHAKSDADTAAFRFAGKIMGKCLYDSAVRESHHLLTVHFTRSFLKLILGVPISYHDFEKDDPQLFKSKVQFMIGNKIDDAGLDLTMSEEHYAPGGKLLETVELVPNGKGISVNDNNKRMYLTLLARHRLGLSTRPSNTETFSPQVKAFIEGFYTLVPPNLLETFDDNELELLVCGMAEVNVSDFKDNTAYPGIRDPFSDPIVQWFWLCVENMSKEDRSRLLQFVTGSSQVPPGGFKTVDPKVNIKLNHSPPSHLPVSHTCFNTLELPRYRSFEQLQERLSLAIKEGAEGFGEA